MLSCEIGTLLSCKFQDRNIAVATCKISTLVIYKLQDGDCSFASCKIGAILIYKLQDGTLLSYKLKDRNIPKV